MERKLVSFLLIFFSLILVVVATAPNSPTQISPSDGAKVLNFPYLQISNVTDPEGDPVNFLFWGNWSGENTTTTDISESWNTVASVAGTPSFTGGGGYATPYVISINGNGGTNNYIRVSKLFKFEDNSWTVQLQKTDSNLNTGEFSTIYVNNTQLFQSSDTFSALNQTLDVTQYNDGNMYNITFEVTSGSSGNSADGSDLRFWWYDRGQNPLKNSSELNFLWENTSQFTTGVGKLLPETYNWYAQACDNNSECSANTPSRTVKYLNFSSLSTAIAINYTIRDEQTNSLITSTDFNPTFTISTNEDSEEYTFNPSSSSSFVYSLEPLGEQATLDSSITYSATNYAQRTFSQSGVTINSSNPQLFTIYLLNSTNGAYITFQVIDLSGTPIQGAQVTIQKTISSVLTTVASGTTDSGGSFTAFLDPLTSHTVTVSKSSYQDTSISVVPSTTPITITLGGTASNITSYFQGISYQITPTEIILNNNTVYNFSLNIVSSYWNLSSYGFNLTSENGTLLNSTSDNEASGSYLSVLLDTNNYTQIDLNFYWDIDNNLNYGKQSWKVKSTYEGELSIKNFFDRLSSFAGVGWDNFGRIILSIIIILGVTFWLSKDLAVYNPLGIATVITALIWVLAFASIIPPMAINGVEQKYLIPSLVTVILIAFYVASIQEKAN